MPFPIQIIGFGHKKETLTGEADHYLRLLGHYADCTLTYLKPPGGKKTDPNAIVENEGRLLMSKVPGRAFLVSLSQEGKAFTSKAFSAWLAERALAGTPLAFMIGGAYGLSASIKKQSREVISLSQLTLPHRLCYTILIEQLYRAFTILKGHPYHK